MRVWTAAVGIGVLACLTFGAAPVAADSPPPACEGFPATIVGTGGPI